MKRTPTKRLQLNLDTVRTLQHPHTLDDRDLQRVVGGLKSGSGYSACQRSLTEDDLI